jgi:acetolactate decarboxylase
MKPAKILLITLLLLTALTGCLETEKSGDVLFQTSTINALLEGVYDGNVTFAELKKHGDFGIGTFNALDGEMIALDGEFYQIKSDGVAYGVSDSAKTPFSVVTFFSADERMQLDEIVNYSMLEQSLESRFPSKNIFYAIIKIEDF